MIGGQTANDRVEKDMTLYDGQRRCRPSMDVDHKISERRHREMFLCFTSMSRCVDMNSLMLSVSMSKWVFSLQLQVCSNPLNQRWIVNMNMSFSNSRSTTSDAQITCLPRESSFWLEFVGIFTSVLFFMSSVKKEAVKFRENEVTPIGSPSVKEFPYIKVIDLRDVSILEIRISGISSVLPYPLESARPIVILILNKSHNHTLQMLTTCFIKLSLIFHMLMTSERFFRDNWQRGSYLNRSGIQKKLRSCDEGTFQTLSPVSRFNEFLEQGRLRTRFLIVSPCRNSKNKILIQSVHLEIETVPNEFSAMFCHITLLFFVRTRRWIVRSWHME